MKVTGRYKFYYEYDWRNAIYLKIKYRIDNKLHTYGFTFQLPDAIKAYYKLETDNNKESKLTFIETYKICQEAIYKEGIQTIVKKLIVDDIKEDNSDAIYLSEKNKLIDSIVGTRKWTGIEFEINSNEQN